MKKIKKQLEEIMDIYKIPISMGNHKGASFDMMHQIAKRIPKKKNKTLTLWEFDEEKGETMKDAREVTVLDCKSEYYNQGIADFCKALGVDK